MSDPASDPAPWRFEEPLAVALEGLADGQGATIDLPVGRIAWSRSRRAALFEAAPEALAAGVPLSPHGMPLASGLTPGDPAEFGGLNGVFADSLPDGWGTLLVDREAEARGLRRADLTPVDRLAIVGRGGMGALTYRPEAAPDAARGIDLDELGSAAERVLREAGEVPLEDAARLRAALGGSGGARPKIVCQIGPDDILRPADAPPEPGFAHWIVKFAGPGDGAHVAEVERAYATMAAAAGIDMPATRLVRRAGGRAVLAIRRFDREVVADGQGARLRRRHMLSASGALESEHGRYAFDYATLLTWIRQLVRDVRAVEEGLRRAAFNAMAHNRDDHGRQHSALLDRDAHGAWRWRLAPAYDLTPSDGPGGEHALAIGGQGRDVDRAALGRLARAAGVPDARRDAILAEVAAAVTDWAAHADAAGVPAAVRGRVGRLHRVVG